MLSGVYLGGNAAGGDTMALTDAELRATPVPVTVSNLPATQPVSGTVAVSNLPATQVVSGTVAVSGAVPVTGPLTDTALRAAAVPVSLAVAPTTPVTGTFWPGTQPVSGSVSVSNLPATQPVSGTVTATGPLTNAELRASALPISGTFWQATQPVSLASAPTTPVTGTFWQATQPVSLASAPTTPVTGSFWQATQPVSGSVSVSNFPATQPVSIASAPTTPVTGTFFQATQPVSIAAVVSSTLGNSTGKTLAMKTGSIVTTATTADQVILTYTVTTGKTLYLQYLNFQCRLTAFAATATLFGTASFESPAGTKLITRQIIGTGSYDVTQEFAEPLPFAAGTVVRVVCTPAAITSFTWQCSLGGFER